MINEYAVSSRSQDKVFLSTIHNGLRNYDTCEHALSTDYLNCFSIRLRFYSQPINLLQKAFANWLLITELETESSIVLRRIHVVTF